MPLKSESKGHNGPDANSMPHLRFFWIPLSALPSLYGSSCDESIQQCTFIASVELDPLKTILVKSDTYLELSPNAGQKSRLRISSEDAMHVNQGHAFNTRQLEKPF
jgi:hypothetical protein